MKLQGFLGRARKESKLSVLRIQVGAVCTKGGSAISFGYNQDKSHPMVSTFSLHAEAAAILARRYHIGSLEGATIWVYRETADGIPAWSRPCKECLKLIIASKIKKIVYSTGEPPYYNIIYVRGLIWNV